MWKDFVNLFSDRYHNESYHSSNMSASTEKTTHTNITAFVYFIEALKRTELLLNMKHGLARQIKFLLNVAWKNFSITMLMDRSMWQHKFFIDNLINWVNIVKCHSLSLPIFSPPEFCTLYSVKDENRVELSLPLSPWSTVALTTGWNKVRTTSLLRCDACLFSL